MVQIEAARSADHVFVQHFRHGDDPHCQLLQEAATLHIKHAVAVYCRHMWQLRTPELKYAFIEKVFSKTVCTGAPPSAPPCPPAHLYIGDAPFRTIMTELECACVIIDMIRPAPAGNGRDSMLFGDCPITSFQERILSAHMRMAVILYDRALALYPDYDIERRLYDRFRDTFGDAVETVKKEFYGRLQRRVPLAVHDG